jgi:Fic family protein
LETLGWWDEISKNKSHHIRLIDECRKLRREAFSFEIPCGSNIIDAFFKTIESIEDEVARLTNKLRNRKRQAREVEEFAELRDVISTYLGHAVVPSTLYVRNEFKKPNAIVVLNAAHLFYLSGIEGLMNNSDKPDPTDIMQRDIWMERVENWTTKALENIALPNVGGA